MFTYKVCTSHSASRFPRWFKGVRNNPVWVATSASLFVLMSAVSAKAAGFAVQEYSVRDLGAANAGGAALAQDATTVFSNPAGMTRLDRVHINAGVHAILGKGRFTNQGSVDAIGQPLSGGTGGDFLSDALVPNFYAVIPLSDRLRFGVGVSAPYGLSTEYDDDWVGRYQGIKSSMKTIDINPSVAYRLTDFASIGVGMSIQYVDVDISNAIDFGAVCLGQVEPVAPGTCGALGVLPQAADGAIRLKGKDWSFGWNVGLLLQVSTNTRVGLHYRSEVNHKIDGHAVFTTPAALAPLMPSLGGAFLDSDGRAGLSLPQRASVSLYHDVSDRFSIMADVTWTGWSSFHDLHVEFANPAQPDLLEEQDYKDVWRVAGGASYKLSDSFTVRGGVAYDKSPTRDIHRSPRIPDNDRIVAAVGMSWEMMNGFTVDAAYNRLFIKDSSVDRIGSSGDRLIGENKGHANLVALGLNVAF